MQIQQSLGCHHLPISRIWLRWALMGCVSRWSRMSERCSGCHGQERAECVRVFSPVLVAGMMLAWQNKSIAVTHWPEELILTSVILHFCKRWCNSQNRSVKSCSCPRKCRSKTKGRGTGKRVEENSMVTCTSIKYISIQGRGAYIFLALIRRLCACLSQPAWEDGQGFGSLVASKTCSLLWPSLWSEEYLVFVQTELSWKTIFLPGEGSQDSNNLVTDREITFTEQFWKIGMQSSFSSKKGCFHR